MLKSVDDAQPFGSLFAVGQVGGTACPGYEGDGLMGTGWNRWARSEPTGEITLGINGE